jgi:hypothetical protein
MSHPRIALVHATPIAVEPIHAAFRSLWPEARPIDIMDYSLSGDREAVGRINDTLTERIEALSRYGISTGAQAVLFTCSAFGAAIERARLLSKVPVLRPNEAMFEAAISMGNRIAMICPFEPAAGSMAEEFREEVGRTGSAATMETILVPGAIEAVRAGDVETHNRLVAEKAASLKGFDAITLAHFSTARALAAAQASTETPVFSSPEAAVAKLKRTLEGHGQC